jgi:hypothetical protein
MPFAPAWLVPVASQVGVVHRNHHHVAGSGLNGVRAAWAQVLLLGLERLDDPHRHGNTQERVELTHRPMVSQRLDARR